MKSKLVYKAGLLAFGLGMITVGVVILAQGRFVLDAACIIGGLVFIVHGIHLIFNFFFKKTVKSKKRLIPEAVMGLINIAGGMLLIFFRGITKEALIILFIVYVFLNAVVKLIDFITARINQVSGRLYDLIAFIFFFTFGIITCFIPDMGYRSLLIVAGNYCILYGVCQVNDFVVQIIPVKTKTKLKRNIRISTPVFIATFMPLWFLRSINRMVSDNEMQASHENSGNGENQTPNFEVLIHISEHGSGKVGHCDLVIDGRVMSYGNYDLETSKFMRIYGEGILFTTEFKPYIRYAVTHDKKTIISYGFLLSEEQLALVKAEIDELFSLTYLWKPPLQVEREKEQSTAESEKSDFCSMMWLYADGKFYKFNSGRYKSYFVLSTNCVLLADSILGKAGTDIVKINGIITPGSYFDYLQGEFLRPNTMVISRTIYTKENTDEFKISEGISWED